MMRLSSQPSLLFVHVTKGTKSLVKVDVFILKYLLQFLLCKQELKYRYIKIAIAIHNLIQLSTLPLFRVSSSCGKNSV